MPETFTLIDDKHVPLARIVWVADIPHFCGDEGCTVEGKYEIRLDADDSLFSTREERDATLDTLKGWYDAES